MICATEKQIEDKAKYMPASYKEDCRSKAIIQVENGETVYCFPEDVYRELRQKYYEASKKIPLGALGPVPPCCGKKQ